MVFFAYIGFDSVSVAAQEAKNPQRDVPLGILGSLVIAAALYMLMALVLVGITDYRTLNVPNPVSFAVGEVPALAWLALPINIGALTGLASVVFVSLYGQSRIFYCMARDGFLWPLFGQVHPTFRTPASRHLVTGAIAAVSGRALSARDPRRSRLDRNAAGVRRRLHRHHDAAGERAQRAPPLPYAVRVVHRAGRVVTCTALMLQPFHRDLDSPGRLDSDRSGDLFRLWLSPRRAVQVESKLISVA